MTRSTSPSDNAVADPAGGDDLNGDFTAVYDRHFTAVYRYVAGRLGGQVAEDVVADVFLGAFTSRGRYDPAKASLRVWLLGIATNHIARHHRSETARYRALARDGGTLTTTAGDEDPVPGLDPRLAGALAGLTHRERDVLLLAVLGEQSHEEIAQALRIPYGTVGSRLNRARRKLRAALAPNSDSTRPADSKGYL